MLLFSCSQIRSYDIQLGIAKPGMALCFSLDLLPSILVSFETLCRWPVRLLIRSRGGKANGDKQRSGQKSQKSRKSAKFFSISKAFGFWIVFLVSEFQAVFDIS